jgi:hypothetical protein
MDVGESGRGLIQGMAFTWRDWRVPRKNQSGESVPRPYFFLFCELFNDAISILRE